MHTLHRNYGSLNRTWASCDLCMLIDTFHWLVDFWLQLAQQCAVDASHCSQLALCTGVWLMQPSRAASETASAQVQRSFSFW